MHRWLFSAGFRLRQTVHGFFKPCAKGFIMTMQNTLLETFNYDPDTGALTYRKPRGTLPAGRPAGTATKAGVSVLLLGCKTVAHRIIWNMMTGEWPQHPIRHVNGDKLDNRWSNLEVRVPLRNREPITRQPVPRSTNQVPAHGVGRVDFNKMGVSRFEANAIVKGERVFLGRFETKAEAEAAFKNATGYAAPGSL
jgi:hypothetical protein